MTDRPKSIQVPRNLFALMCEAINAGASDSANTPTEPLYDDTMDKLAAARGALTSWLASKVKI